MSTDGSKYFSSAGDGDNRLVDIASGNTITRYCGHFGDASALCFAREDKGQKLFATCSTDKTVKLWDAGAGKCVMSLEPSQLASGNGQKNWAPPKVELNSCAMFPAERCFVAAAGEGDFTFLYDIRAGKLLQTYCRNNKKTKSICFSSSGRVMYCGQDDGSIIVWDIWQNGENKKYAEKKMAHTTMVEGTQNPDETLSEVKNMELSSTGVLASAGFDGTVKLWKAKKNA